MKKLFAAVAMSAFALTSAVPAVQAAPLAAGLYQTDNANLHQVAAAKKKTATKKPAKKKVSKAGSSTKKMA
ncbi:MAG: hypothetical protein JO021_17565 [Alphaproteobacteria bacterium]|nr:hypothetical protein [Alphaproteobacteria bacterium]